MRDKIKKYGEIFGIALTITLVISASLPIGYIGLAEASTDLTMTKEWENLMYGDDRVSETAYSSKYDYMIVGTSYTNGRMMGVYEGNNTIKWNVSVSGSEVGVATAKDGIVYYTIYGDKKLHMRYVKNGTHKGSVSFTNNLRTFTLAKNFIVGGTASGDIVKIFYNGTKDWKTDVHPNNEYAIDQSAYSETLNRLYINKWNASASNDEIAAYSLNSSTPTEVYEGVYPTNPKIGEAHGNTVYVSASDYLYEKIDNGTALNDGWNKYEGSSVDNVKYSSETKTIYYSSSSTIIAAYPENGSNKYSSATSNIVQDIAIGGTSNESLYVGIYEDLYQKWSTNIEKSSTNYGHVEENDTGNAINDAKVGVYQSGSLLKTVYTDSNGDFSVDLKNGDYTIKVSKSGYHNTQKSVTVSGSTNFGTFKLENKTETISGKITDQIGDSLNDAKVVIKDSGAKVKTVYTNSTGEWSVDLTEGDYSANVSKPGYYPNNTTFSFVDDKDIGTIELTNQTSPGSHSVNITVINDTINKEPVENAEIIVYQNGNEIARGATDKNGELTFGLDNGTYTFNITKQYYHTRSVEVEVDGDMNVGKVFFDPKEYKLHFRVSPYMNHSETQKYSIRFNGDTINNDSNLTIVVSNSSLLTVSRPTQTLNSTSNINLTGEVNVTAYYEVDGKNISVSQNVSVAPLNVTHVEILSPLYSTLALVGDTTIQYIVLTVIAGAGVTLIINSFAGIGIMIFALIFGWIANWVGLGILLASLFGGIFIMMNTNLGLYQNQP